MIPNDGNYLMHYGTKRHSGRYPWGSGEHPYQHSSDFLARIEELRKEGNTDSQIASWFGLNTSQFRVQRSLASSERRAEQVEHAKHLMDKCGGNVSEVARRMNINESTVRSLLKTSSEARMNQAQNTAEFLKKQIEEKGMIDIGTGVERSLGISPEMLKNSLYILEREGYPVYKGRLEQQTNPGQYTTQKVLCAPGTEYKQIYQPGAIKTVEDYTSYDKGESFKKTTVYPSSLDSKRVEIRYAEDGGTKKDGVIEIRRGVEDLSLGNSHYAQVRILVDGSHYIKGMAIYADDKDLPPGCDVLVNSNKSRSKGKMGCLKEINTTDPENPFGALIKEKGQSYYIGKDGKEHLSKINKTREEGDWNDWDDTLPAQFLAKQPLPLVKKQLDLSIKNKEEEFNDIMSVTNPVVKRSLLKDFADDCDSTSVSLKAAALPRQKYKVILPIKSMKDDEVYAPSYEDGEKVALIRFPHGGLFEIPILTVNNKQAEGKRVLGGTVDAVGINSKVAEQLSGADFDGDTVMVIPTSGNGKNRGVTIKNKSPLKELQNFDNKTSYPYIPGMTVMKKGSIQKEMGSISNLITDMTIKGATEDELARAVKHSMVVIDAYKHKLNYKQSEKDNNIKELVEKYQGHYDVEGNYKVGGASTLISRAKAEQRVEKRGGTEHINQKGKAWYDPSKPEGTVLYTEKPEIYIDKKGKEQHRLTKSTQMAETNDARKLSSGYAVEEVYADYANALKNMGNTARKELVYTPRLKYDPAANKKYSKEVEHLNAQYSMALRNAPKEREAQRIASSYMKSLDADNPDMTKEERKKHAQRSLTKARVQVGAERYTIKFSDKEWEAVQSGAISDTKLEGIMKYADPDNLRQRATPRNTKGLRDSQIAKANAMRDSGYTIAQIATSLGVSPSTVTQYMDPRKE